MDDELELLRRFTVSVSNGKGDMAMITTTPAPYTTDRQRCIEAFLSCMTGIGFSFGGISPISLAEEMDGLIPSAVK